MIGARIAYKDGSEELVARAFGVYRGKMRKNGDPNAFVIQRKERGKLTWLKYQEVATVAYNRPDLLKPQLRPDRGSSPDKGSRFLPGRDGPDSGGRSA